MISYCNYQYLCLNSYRKSACCTYFDLFTIETPVRIKHHLHSRHLASYLVYGIVGIVCMSIVWRYVYPKPIYSSVGLLGGTAVKAVTFIEVTQGIFWGLCLSTTGHIRPLQGKRGALERSYCISAKIPLHSPFHPSRDSSLRWFFVLIPPR
jgi:hypothetical protein